MEATALPSCDAADELDDHLAGHADRVTPSCPHRGATTTGANQIGIAFSGHRRMVREIGGAALRRQRLLGVTWTDVEASTVRPGWCGTSSRCTAAPPRTVAMDREHAGCRLAVDLVAQHVDLRAAGRPGSWPRRNARG